MIEIIIHVLVTAGLLMVVGRLVDGIDVETGKAAIFGALTLGLVNAFVRPVLVVLTLPITVLTLGLFLIVINAITLTIAAAIVSGFKVKNFKAALWGSVLLSLFNLFVSTVFGM